jgi:hypothetical protein
MNITGFFFFLVVAVLITLFFSYGFRIKGPWGNIWTFFMLVFLTILLVGVWILPAGPMYRGIYYLPPLVAGILVALLLAATTPSPRTRAKLERRDEEKEDADFYAIGIFFWVLFALMIIILGIGYFTAVN